MVKLEIGFPDEWEIPLFEIGDNSVEYCILGRDKNGVYLRRAEDPKERKYLKDGEKLRARLQDPAEYAVRTGEESERSLYD